MSGKIVVTMKLAPELHDMFIAEAAADGRLPAEVLHDLIRDYVDRRRQARDYDDFLRRKVERGRMDWDAGRHVSNDEAEAQAAARRERLLRGMAGAADTADVDALMNALHAGECSGEPRPWDDDAFLARMTARYGG